MASENKLFSMSFADLYRLYVEKAERKARSEGEVGIIICWLTGYSNEELMLQLASKVDVETFFRASPRPHPNRALIKGSICGVKLAEMEEGLMKEIRYLDKLIDELARGKSFDKILRS